ncbi:MAG: flagellar protein FlgN [Phycisphaerae bacterium]|nr:flagellar protein FlgN [Phycisphaerae bacterium]
MITFQEALTMGNQMLELLKRQHLYFQELEKLSESQRVLIKAQQSEDLLHILGKRQKLVMEIGEIHQQSASYRENWPNFKDLLPEHLRNSISELLGQLQTMLNAIIEQDKQDCQELSQTQQQISAEIQQTGRAKAATASYGKPKNLNYNQDNGGSIQFTG